MNTRHSHRKRELTSRCPLRKIPKDPKWPRFSLENGQVVAARRAGRGRWFRASGPWITVPGARAARPDARRERPGPGPILAAGRVPAPRSSAEDPASEDGAIRTGTHPDGRPGSGAGDLAAALRRAGLSDVSDRVVDRAAYSSDA